MNCLESHEFLHRRLDGAPADPAAMTEHLSACPACCALHAAAQRLEAGLRLLVPPLPPAGLGERVVSAVLSAHRARNRRRRWVLGTAALAASLLVAALVGYRLVGPADGPGPVPPTPFVEGAQPEPATPSLRDGVAEASSVFASITRRKADETVGPARLLLPVVTPPPLDDMGALTEPLDPPARTLREAGQGVSAGLEPVTTSARRAFDLFLREIPPMGAEPKSGL